MESRSAAAVTVGVFDGVHRGHRALIQQMVTFAKQHAFEAGCVTFDPDPAEVLQPEEPHLALCSLSERLDWLRTLGVERVEVAPFSQAFSTQSADEFIAWMGERFELRSLWVGNGFALGHGRSGTITKLQEIGLRRGFEVRVVEPVDHGGRTISSTWIRSLLFQGDVALAAELLGGPYCLGGEIISGARRGREMGFPTANVLPPSGRVLPGDGVYLVQARIGARHEGATPKGGPAGMGDDHFGVANLGGRPTFGESERLIEAHLLDFSGDVYGAHLDVCFLQQLRGVRRFAGIEDLRDQINRDVAAARELIRTRA